MWTLNDPAEFSEWGGDDSGLQGQVWEEFIDERETRRCEKWGDCWLFAEGPLGGWEGGSRLTADELAQLRERGYPLHEIDQAEFERVWKLATELGSQMNPYGDAKIRAVRATRAD